MVEQPRICDYEGSDYRTRFWEGQGRNYEDTVERQVLRRLLPEHGKRLLEIGAGFGRLTQEYNMYEQVVLLDYSFSQLQYARDQLGDEGYVYVAADAYKLPFKPGVFDGATMIRVLHHFEDVPNVFSGIQRVMSSGATFVLEYANKRNLKAMARYALRRQKWNPYTYEPVEFVELNYDFHPSYILRELQSIGFSTQEYVPVSWFRMGALKRAVPMNMLVAMDGMMQSTRWLLSPSVFTKNVMGQKTTNNLDVALLDIFACPLTGGALTREDDRMVNADGVAWAITDGIYDFKEPIIE
ncbi:methyltransferase domain-containing protein [Phototrophicus methaneseepsis]|uniref:Methyltransferase domain-containing protein n=1 Tax=Phototrophicus methaneseepsis TaxID=2710758 RepID=A0A7S8EDP4_9CHLR|nr:methyltransferase domain-containing protein [Phototrophicus methaneseepsis]QPC85052.1 methyltransferase domain-containing protein [Phototrophicus methaneseepsis]